MRQRALEEALKTKKTGKLAIPAGFSGKTKDLAILLTGDKSYLLITECHQENIWRAARNMANVTVIPQNLLNTYEVLKAEKIFTITSAHKAPVKAKKGKKS